ncbi:MAG TPA: hypothetical protein VKU83_11015, partial [Puia sp.]|nr:hypothetical protein [Puia sp.]
MKPTVSYRLTLLFIPLLLSANPRPRTKPFFATGSGVSVIAPPRNAGNPPQTADSTYAERLGYPPGARVLIIHVDDA